MNYEKMWKTLRWKLICSQGKILSHSNGEDHKAVRNPRNFASRLINAVLEIMEEIEKEG